MAVFKRHSLSFLVILAVVIPLILSAQKYRPFPILFVHGLGADSATWDAVRLREKVPNLYQYFNSINTAQPDPYEDPFPGATYLEVFSFRDNQGSVDGENGQGLELVEKIKQVLIKYYGDWTNPKAKLILVCHSMGGLAAREALRIAPEIRTHIAKVITITTPHQGSPWATWGEAEAFLFLLMYILPVYQDNFPKIDIEVGFTQEQIQFLASFSPLKDWPLLIPALGELAIWIIGGHFSEAGADLARPIGPYNSFLKTLNSSHLPTLEKGYTCIIANKWCGEPLSDIVVAAAGMLAGVQAAWAATKAVLAGLAGDVLNAAKYTLIAGLKVASGVFWFNWVYNSDMIVWEESQNLANIYKNRDDIEIIFLSDWHCGAPKRWQTILEALEEPPKIYLDSIVIDSAGVKEIVVPLNKPVNGVVTDTVCDLPKIIYGRVEDYLLASNDFKFKVNIGNWEDNSWSTGRLGNEGNMPVMQPVIVFKFLWEGQYDRNMAFCDFTISRL